MPIFAVLVVGGLAFGMLALSVDVGNVWYERRQLQNAADATAISLAHECAEAGNAPDLCASDNPNVDSLLNLNVQPGEAQFAPDRYAAEGACERIDFGPLPDCAVLSEAALADLSECQPLPEWLRNGSTIPYVETYTRTRSGEPDNTLLPGFFSQLVVGGEPELRVSACSRAAWGPPKSYTGTIPITFSVCEWQYYMDEYGGDYAPAPGPAGYGTGPGQVAWPTLGQEKIIYLKAGASSGEPRDCSYNEMNDFPGAFGFVESVGCQATVATGGWLDTKTGTSVPNDCKTYLEQFHNTTVSLPVFDCMQGGLTAPTEDVEDIDDCEVPPSGTHAWYHIAGWAKFYVSGVRAPSVNLESSVSGQRCSNDETCLMGWFVEGSLNAEEIGAPGGPSDFGTYAVLPAG